MEEEKAATIITTVGWAEPQLGSVVQQAGVLTAVPLVLPPK